MSRVSKNELYREIKNNVIDNERKNDARGELYYQLSENGWNNQSMDDCISLGEVFYTYHYELRQRSEGEAISYAVEDLTAYLSSAIANGDREISNRLSRSELDAVDEAIRMGEDIIDEVKRASSRSRDTRRYGDDRRESRRFDSRDNYSRNDRRNDRYSDPVRSRGSTIGRGRPTGDSRRLADEPTSRRYTPPARPVHSDRRQTAPEPEKPVEKVETGPKRILQQSSAPAEFDLTVKVAHEFFDVTESYPLYDVTVDGNITGEIHVPILSKTGENIKASNMDHRSYLFFNRRGTTESTGDLEHARTVYRRMSQHAVKFSETVPELNPTEGTVTGQQTAEFPRILNTVPFIVDTEFETTTDITDVSKASTIIDYVNDCLIPLNPSYDYTNSIIIGNVKHEYRFVLESTSSSDADKIAETFAMVSKRNNVASVVQYLELLLERLPMREWNMLNNAATDMFNDIAKIEFGMPAGINSLYRELKDYLDIVNEQFGDRISEALSDQLHRVVLSTLNMKENPVGEDGVRSFSLNSITMIVMLPIEARDVEIGLAHETTATGIVSQSTMPYLYEGLSSLMKLHNEYIRKICIFTRDAEMVTLHYSKHTDAILLHRED